MDGPESTECLDCTKDYLDEKLGWLKEFRNDLYRWKDVVTVVKEAEMFVKFQGFYRESHHDLNVIPTFTARTIQGKRIRSELLMFVKQESQKSGKNDRLLGSSEVIESVFGKMKRLEQDQAKSGFTVFILGLAAMVAETTVKLYRKPWKPLKQEP